MPKNIFRGDAVPVAQVTKITPTAVEAGDVFILAINGKEIEYTAAQATAADVVAGLLAAWQASTIPEFLEVIPSAGTDANGAVTHLVLTAAEPGRPFVVTASTSNSVLGNVTVTETTKGVEPRNEVQKVLLVGNYTGGTFTLKNNFGSGVETTAAIAYNATAASVQTAIEGLASVNPGDVVVTGGPGPANAWFVQWQGAFAESEVPEFTIDGTNLTGTSAVLVETLTEGAGKSNEIQIVDVNAVATGVFTLTFNGQTTSILQVNATPAQVQAALEALPNIGAGNVAVYGFGGTTEANKNQHFYFVLFKGALAETNVSQLELQVFGSPSPQFCYAGTLQQGGQSVADEFQFLDFAGATSGTFALIYDGVQTAQIDVTGTTVAVTTAVRIELGKIPAIGDPANVDVAHSGFITGGVRMPCILVRFKGAKANTNMKTLQINGAGLVGSAGASVTVVHEGEANRNEVQSIKVLAAGGNFTLSDGVETTSAIAWNASAATVKTRLENDLTSVITVTVTGTGTAVDPYVVTYTNPGNKNVTQLVGNASGLTGGGGQVTEVTPHQVSANEVQTIALGVGVTGGTFTLAFGGAITNPIAFNATAATMKTALEALATIGTGNVNVTGSAGGPWTVTFQGILADQDVPLLVADGSDLDGGAGTQGLSVIEVFRSRGPSHFDDPDNWTLAHVPETAEDLIVEQGDTPLLYGLVQLTTFTADAAADRLTMAVLGDFVEGQKVRVTNIGGALPAGLSSATDYYVVALSRDNKTLQLATTPGGAAVNITDAGTGTHWIGARVNSGRLNSRYTAPIGNPQENESGYYEYRPLFLRIGLLSTGAKSILIGHGPGSGSTRMRLDFGPDQYAADVLQTGGSGEPGVPALLLQGTHASSTLQVLDGDVGVAYLEGDTSALARLTQRGGTVHLGQVTLAELDKTGGQLFADEAVLNGAFDIRG